MPPVAPFDVEIHDMELGGVLKEQEEDSGKGKKNLSELLMDEAHPEEENEDEQMEEKGTKTQEVN